MVEYLPFVVGAGIVSFLMLYFGFNLEGEKHYLLRLITVFFALGLLLVIPSLLVESTSNVCDSVVHNSTLVGDTITYEYTSYCYEVTLGSPSTFLKATLWFYRVFILYIILYLGYNALLSMKSNYNGGKL